MTRSNESGFTLVELLVVIAIIGILAGLAIPVYAGYKQQSVDAQMKHALHVARVASEIYFAENGQSYVGMTVPDLVAHGYREAPGVDLMIVDAQVDSYRFRACTLGGTAPSYVADSATGLMAPDAGSC
jgi:prepilin-type N-terminal cleavage/methylation domain-containing protein